MDDWHNLYGWLPYGGYSQSGLGRKLGPDALDGYMQQKAISVDSSGRPRHVGWVLPFGVDNVSF
jgi:aldehyde dehydrogenase (NAD+)